MSEAKGQHHPVLIVSTKLDVATDAVCTILNRDGVPFWRWNTEDYPYYTEVSATPAIGSIEQHSVPPDADESAVQNWRSLWYRRVRSPEPPDFWTTAEDLHLHDYCAREAYAFIVGASLSYRGPIMSSPSAIFAAEHKLYQLRLARDCGLTSPRTVVANRPIDVESAYYAFRRQMICKPVRSGHVAVGEGEGLSIFTSQVLDEHIANVERARLCPSIYQELIPKRYDVRVTFVGGRAFPVRIDSQGDPDARVDWRRTANASLPMQSAELPSPVMSSLHLLVRRMNLSFAAIDLVEDLEGNYVFLEVNPSGQWIWIDDALDLGISEAVAAWLVSGGETDRVA